LLAAEGHFQPFDGLSDPLPDGDGSFAIIVAVGLKGPPGPIWRVGRAFSLALLRQRQLAPDVRRLQTTNVYPALVDSSNPPSRCAISPVSRCDRRTPPG
jgi:hypothetical protein